MPIFSEEKKSEGKSMIAKVVSILNKNKIVINKGTSSGVRVGNVFSVYALGDEIIDPDDGQSLGRLNIPRGRGKVISVQEKMAIIESINIKLVKQNVLFGISEEERILPFDDPNIGDFAENEAR